MAGNLAGLGIEDLITQGMTNMFRDTDDISKFLRRVPGETRLNSAVVNRPPEAEPEECTDVNGVTQESSHRALLPKLGSNK